MKHEQLVKPMLAELHEPWMTDQEKVFLDDELIRMFGAELDAAIEALTAKGVSEDQQSRALREMIRLVKR